MTFARLFGAGIANDAFLVAFRIPNLLRDLFAEGALSSAFIPTFTDYLRNRSVQQAFHLANLVLGALMLLLGGYGLLLLAFPDQALFLVASGYADDPEKAQLAAKLIRIFSPFLLFVSWAAVAMGMLNALGHFFLPALAPAVFNAVVILCGYTLAPLFESRGIDPILAMAAGVVVGGFLQFGVQIPLMRRHGMKLRLRFDWRHEGIRRIGRLVGPAVIGAGAVQLNILISTQMATYLSPSDGPVSWLAYSFRLIYLPIGLVGVAVGTVNLRNVSLSAARQDWQELRETVADSLKLVGLLALPAAVGLAVLAEPIVRVIFERGAFTAEDTRFTALALIGYSMALIGYSLQKVFIPTFYALDDTRTPLRISLAAVLFSTVLNLTAVFLVLNRWMPQYAYIGLAGGASATLTLQAILLSRSFTRRMGSLEPFGVVSALARMAAAAALMGVGVRASQTLMTSFLSTESWLGQAAQLAFCMASGALIYFAACSLLGVEEVKAVWRRLRRTVLG